MTPAPNEPSDSTLLPKEVGQRLRLLREQAGLSQEAVALLLGLERTTGKAQISKMETGHYRSGPGFVRVLDYLRACGCGVDALLDVLDRYTSRERVTDEQAHKGVLEAIRTMPPQFARRALYYHVGLSYGGRRRVRRSPAAAERVRRAIARGNSEWQRMQLQHELNNVLSRLHIGWDHTVAIHLRSYGRLVFATMRRLRKARPGWRERAHERLDEWPAKYGLDPAPFRQMKEAVMKLFEKMERAGQI
ncbi:MAG TPA: helix-turn-helix transcriptional regulator [bacterium]|nr:helix-turn-helix transcriptional regulator [bacterium]